MPTSRLLLLLGCCFLLDLAGALVCTLKPAAAGEAGWSQADVPASSPQSLPFLPAEEPEPESETYGPEDDCLHVQAASALALCSSGQGLRPDGRPRSSLPWAASLFQPPERAT